MAKSYRKDPAAVLDYQVDWTEWLEAGDTIVTSTWTVDTGITNNLDAFTTTLTWIWISGGTAGQTYHAVNRVVTDDGRTNEWTITIRVENQ
jgi:hypothetical protein